MRSPGPPASGASHSTTCDYCGLPMPGAASTPASANENAYCCYGCRFAAGIAAHSVGKSQPLGPATALGFSIFFTMNVVMLTMALWSYAGQRATPFEVALGNFLRYGAMAFSLPVLLLLGRPLVSHALAGIKQLTFTTDLLLATGVLAAFVVSIVNTWRGTGHVYFEVGCVILVLVTVGRWLEAAGRSQASAALDQLEELVPEFVQRIEEDREVEVPRAQIAIGDWLRVRAGERIPVDGQVLRGRGVVDEQFFTGESAPVEKRLEDPVLGGSLNLDGDLIIEATTTPDAGALGRLVEAVRTARLSKGRYQLLGDAWSQAFFPIISLVALLAFVVHGMRVDWDFGLMTALSVVLIACPCALALATPLAVWAAFATAARRGVIFRSGAALESLARVRAVRWDKTGTLTTGTPRVRRLVCETISDRADVERLAAAMTHASNHVYSKAIRESLAELEPVGTMPSVQTVAGRGLRAASDDERTILLGSPGWMDEQGLAWGPNLHSLIRDPEVREFPLAAIGYDESVQGVFVLEETIRPETEQAIAACRQLGLDQAVLTGDRACRVAGLSAKFGLPVRAELLPEDKLAAIQAAKAEFGSVAMIGDGLNDAPALAAADVGIALGCGADVSRDSAGMCLLTNDLTLVPWGIEFARQTVHTIRTNLAWSFGYNSLGVIVAAWGKLHPAVAAALMVVSSLMVLGNSLRLSAHGKSGAPDNSLPHDRHSMTVSAGSESWAGETTR